ncbi:SDR family NAD(P)-dependent oxidoreductase [Rubrobacter aplysinae]|uniref:SDR family NAD(P)-dependent oxidoreductase n=1 Tax=Rubrobacter aplysinae TaxID=909625 RepID=UPI00064BA3C3|nr:SDR family oxidoreductase [Rubrobacter aplysinae]
MGVLDQFKLDGKVALVTGAGSGIGRAYAQALSEAGAAVACADLDHDTAQQTASSLEGKAFALEADVSDEAQVQSMVQETVSELGRLDAVFANAGIGGAQEQVFPEASLENWQQVININLTGVWLTAREAAKAMISQGEGGKIVATASIYGFVGGFAPSPGAYNSAKGGVVNLVRDLAPTLAPHRINVSGIAPGFFRTNIGGGLLMDLENETTQQFVAEIERRTPMGKMGDVEDLKGTAVYLASPASDYLTGHTVAVDGGWLAW